MSQSFKGIAFPERLLLAKKHQSGGIRPGLIGFRWIDSPHSPCSKPGPVCYETSKWMLLNENWWAPKVFKHRNCIKVSLRSILIEFQGFSISITLNIITLPTSGKSVVVKNLPRNIILYFSVLVVHKSDFFLSKSHQILMELFLSLKSWKLVISNTSLSLFIFASWLLIQAVFKMQLLELF